MNNPQFTGDVCDRKWWNMLATYRKIKQRSKYAEGGKKVQVC